MMTFAEMHLAIRALLRGTRHRTFVVNVESLETDGTLRGVEWRVCVTDTIPPIYFRGPNPYVIVGKLKQALAQSQTPDTVPDELFAVGVPPENDS